jgi:hypothetical protein
MPVTKEEIDREKAALPAGWGRFGIALERLIELSEPDESLIATCVALNPDYHHTVGFAPGSALNLANTLEEARDATNVVVACTDRRLVLVFTRLGGAPRSHMVIPFEATSIVERDKKAFVLEHNGARIRFRGAAKRPAARLLDALAAKLSTA